MVKADGSPCNGVSSLSAHDSGSVAGVTGLLSSAAEFLAASPASESYSEEQKRGCLACALRLHEPELGALLERLRQLAVQGQQTSPGPGRGRSAESTAVLKALAVLLSVRVLIADTLADALVWRLAREKTWRRELRLQALAVLLKSASAGEEDLLKLALRAPPSAMAAALCALVDADAGASLSEAQQNIVLRLGRGRSPAAVEAAGLDILGGLLQCEASEAKVASRVTSTSWGTDVQETARRIAAGKAGEAAADRLDMTAVKALRREPRERQLARLSGMLRAPRDEPLREAAIVKALADRAESLPGDVVRSVLQIALDVTLPAPSEAADGGGVEASSELLAREICAGGRELLTAEMRLRAFACLLRTPPQLEAVLLAVARSSSNGSLPQPLCRDLTECLLLGKPLAMAEKGRERTGAPQAVLHNALQRTQDVSQAAKRTITDTLLPPAKEATQAAKRTSTDALLPPAKASASPAASLPSAAPATAATPKSSASAAPKPAASSSAPKPAASAPVVPAPASATAPAPAATAAAPGPGRFGLGLLELEPLDDEDEELEPSTAEPGSGGGEEKAAAAAAEGPAAEEEATGWGALKALVQEEDAEEEDEEEDEDDEGSEEASKSDQGEAAEKAGEVEEEDEDDEADDDSEEDENDNDAGDKAESVDDEEDEEGGRTDSDEELEDDGGRSGSEDELESYCGSELDPLGVVNPEDSDAESVEVQSDDGIELTQGGLLTSMFGGGSLHSEEKAKLPRELQLAPRVRAKPSIRVVFPSLIWRGKDVLVVNKPADWICSASDVDKKKGRPLDPNEKVEIKGFKVLDDLLQYKFGDREKKYIHWWIQLMHDLDHKSYPNLFDEDQNYGLCHRLDRETSGTVLVGLTQLARQQMRECFHRHYVRKLYVCLVHGTVEPKEQTVDRNLEAMGQKARLHPGGKRARTHVRVLAYYSKTQKSGRTDEFTLCTCEIAEGRMHQIRLHMSAALGAPIVSEFYYQKSKQMIEDRRWCQRTFLHAYAVGFPDVSGGSRRIGAANGGDCGLVEEAKRDTEQEWHCCICPLTVELRQALQDLTPKDEKAASLLNTIAETGLLDTSHEAVHVMGTEGRKGEIDDSFFPWSSTVNPIEVGDLAKPRDTQRPRPEGKGAGKYNRDGAALRPKAKPRRRNEQRARQRGPSGSPRRHERVRGGKRMRIASRGRPRSPGPPMPPRSRSPGRRGRSRSRQVRRRSISRRRPPGAPPSPRRSCSGPPRRKRRRPLSPTSVSPPPRGSRGPPPRPRRGGSGSLSSAGPGAGPGGRRSVDSPQRVVLTACR